MQESNIIVVGVAVVGRVNNERTDASTDFMPVIALLCSPSHVHKDAGYVDTEWRKHNYKN